MARSLAGKRALVLGLGRFGGGAGAVRFLCEKGARVAVTDTRTASQLAPSLKALDDLEFDRFLGSNPLDSLTDVELLVVNPAVPPRAPLLVAAKKRSIPCTSELELFLERCPAPVIAVTGTNGKSTTTAMIGKILETAGFTTHVGGNLGISLLPLVEQINRDDRVVLEVSSFQADLLPPSPLLDVLVITHVTVDHLDRYGHAKAYQESKERLLQNLKPGGTLIINRDDPVSCSYPVPAGLRINCFGTNEPLPGDLGLDSGNIISGHNPAPEIVIALDELPALGLFQHLNAQAATGATMAVGTPITHIRQGLQAFPGLDHRLQPQPDLGPVKLVDNGVSTVPETTLSALETIPGRVHLVAGGKTKGADLTKFAQALGTLATTVHLFGKVGPDLFEKLSPHFQASDHTCSPKLETALDLALGAAKPGDTLLFSPAFSSFDGYLNFRERALDFRNWAATRREAIIEE